MISGIQLLRAAILPLSLACSALAQTVIVNDTFENFSSYTWTSGPLGNVDNASATFQRSLEPGSSSNHVAQLYFPSASAAGASSGEPPSVNDLYARQLAVGALANPATGVVSGDWSATLRVYVPSTYLTFIHNLYQPTPPVFMYGVAYGATLFRGSQEYAPMITLTTGFNQANPSAVVGWSIVNPFDPSTAISVNGPSGTSLNGWHTLSFDFSTASSTLDYWIDGAKVASIASPGGVPFSYSDAFIGLRNFGPTNTAYDLGGASMSLYVDDFIVTQTAVVPEASANALAIGVAGALVALFERFRRSKKHT